MRRPLRPAPRRRSSTSRRSTPTATGAPSRLLDLPDERLPHLRGPVRHLRRARPQLRRQARRGPTCSTCGSSRSTRPCCFCPPSPTASPCWRWTRTGVGATLGWLAVTGLFGAAFSPSNSYEFAHLIHEGATPQRSAFLSAFFTLVGTHGLHVTFGIVWLVTLMVQVRQHGLIAENQRRLMCLSMFWHFLDVVWIGVFTFVYLMGSMR